MKKIIFVFMTAFVLNAIWENLHSLFYDNYMGGKITEFILLRASLFDALIITLISLPFIYLYFLKDKSWLILVLGTAIAVINEWYGLNTSRWAYNALMPIVPILETGITPTMQLGLLGYFTFKISEKF
jgi:hypothetical protein